MRNKKVLVSGSLVYDHIMSLKGAFSDYIMTDKIHDLNISFSLDNLDFSYGGTAGNIAYNLSLLEQKSQIATSVGTDFKEYAKYFSQFQIGLKGVKVVSGKTAVAHVITDKNDNQISAFYSGVAKLPDFKKVNSQKISLAIISADAKEKMLATLNWCLENNVPYIFDPGQGVFNFNKLELLKFIKNTFLLIGNDYEIEVIKNKLKLGLADKFFKDIMVITTLADKGSVLTIKGQLVKVKAHKVAKVLDPTGAGDAYRAGLIKGLLNNLSPKQAMQLASIVASFPVLHLGTQKHTFSLKQIKSIYYKKYKEKIL